MTFPPVSVVSDWLCPLQTVLLRRGYRRSYIGGSSARELLDHIYFGTDVSLRDLDVYLVKGATAHAEDIRELCGDMNGRTGPVREKRRANPALPGDACYQYLAGYGIHLFCPGRPILSLGVLHHESDLALNGLFDIDTIFLVVANDRSFCHYADQVRQGEDGLILDPHDGYSAWRAKTPEIVHWAEVERCFARSAFRMVRSLAKASQLRLPPSLAAEYRGRRPATVVVDDQLELHRDYVKVLGDPQWAEELSMLAELGALSSISPRLQAEIAATTPDRLRRTIPSPPGASRCELARRRASALRESLPEGVLAQVYGAS